MVSMNFRYLSTLPGLLKLVTTLFLIIALSLGGHAYESSYYNLGYRFLNSVDQVPENWHGLAREKFFMAFTTIVFIFSILSLVCHVSNSEVPYDQRVKAFDILFHGTGAVFLLIGGSLLLDSSRRINNSECKIMDADPSVAGFKCQYRAEKDFGGIFTLATSALYILITVMQVLRFNAADSGHGVAA